MNYRFLSLLPVPIFSAVLGLTGTDVNGTATFGLVTLETVAFLWALIEPTISHSFRDDVVPLLESRLHDYRKEIGLLEGKVATIGNDVQRLKADAIEQVEARKKFAEKYLPGDPWNQP